MSMVWPTFGSRMAEEQNFLPLCCQTPFLYSRSPGASENHEKGQHFSIFQKLAILTRKVCIRELHIIFSTSTQNFCHFQYFLLVWYNLKQMSTQTRFRGAPIASVSAFPSNLFL